MLLSNIIPGFSLAEAKDSINEYEQFKTAMEVCNVFLIWCDAVVAVVSGETLGIRNMNNEFPEASLTS